MFNKLYYSSLLKLTPNSIVEMGIHPLNINKGVPFAFNNYNYIFIEMILELVRLEKFKTKPKRSESVFVCPSKEELLIFLKQHRSCADLYYYEVEPVNFDYKYHIGDFNYHGLSDKIKDDPALKNIKFKDFYTLAEKYWSTESDQCREVVLNSPIKIIKEFDI